jgi:hypothetical protein
MNAGRWMLDVGRWMLDAGCSTNDAQGCSHNKSTTSRRGFDALRHWLMELLLCSGYRVLRGHAICDSSVWRERYRANHPEITMFSMFSPGTLELIRRICRYLTGTWTSCLLDTAAAMRIWRSYLYLQEVNEKVYHQPHRSIMIK